MCTNACASDVVARKPSQSTRLDSDNDTQRRRNGLMASTLRTSSSDGGAAATSDRCRTCAPLANKRRGR